MKRAVISVCACGCGRSFKQKPTGRVRKYFDDACRKRGNREDRGEIPPAVTMCACGCGQPAIGRRKLYASDACKQRQYRKRKEFDELGGDYEWSQRPETPRKKDKRGYKITLGNW